MSSDNTEVANADAEVNGAQEDSGFHTDESLGPAPVDQESSAAPAKKKGRGKWILFIVVLVLLLCSAGGGWYFAKEQWLSQQSDITSGVEARLSLLDAELAALSEQLDTQTARQSNAESALVATAEETEAQLLSLASRISQAESTNTGDWVLAEAEYLLRIANQRLVTSQDINGAIEMMSAADNIFRELAYPELIEARRQLVADMTNLGLVQPVDYEGIYFGLDALLPRVATLSGSHIERLTGENADVTSESTWNRYWLAAVDAVRPYVVINSSEEVDPHYLVSEEQESLVRSEVQLQIRQAQLAMMSNEPSMYEAALVGAADNVEQIFVNDEQTSALATSLREFAERPISGESLDISATIRAVERVVDQMSRVQSGYSSDSTNSAATDQ